MESVAPRPAVRLRVPFGLAAALHLVAIFGLPFAAVGLVIASAAPLGALPLAVALSAAPLVYAVLFVLVAGLLSRLHRHGVKSGLFRRDLRDPEYRARRLYGLCWTSVYYATPLYFLALSLPWFKRLTFRLFGYRGQMDFTVYPDTWIRDLPLLEFGPGAYVSNKATLGTNLAKANGTLLVDHVRIGRDALVGHLAMISTGTVLEEGAEVGVGCAVGSRVRLRRRARLGACCAVGHLADVGEGAQVGYMSSLGVASRIAGGVRLAEASLVPDRARIDEQAAADALLSSAHSGVPGRTPRAGDEAPSKRGPKRTTNPDAAPPSESDRAALVGGRWNAFE